MAARTVLILGGTRDAREVAGLLVQKGVDVVTSLAGVTAAPEHPAGRLRLGGFGGAGGLAAYLAAAQVALVIDATHPFAAQIARNAHEACRAAGVPLLRLERPAWQPAEGDRWIAAASAEEAAGILPEGARVLLTIGRKEVAPFFARAGLSGIARMIEEPPVAVPPGWSLVRARPPFSLQQEIDLLSAQAISHLVSKNAGGRLGREKIAAAKALQLPVVMIARPARPDVPLSGSVEALVEAVARLLSP